MEKQRGPECSGQATQGHGRNAMPGLIFQDQIQTYEKADDG